MLDPESSLNAGGSGTEPYGDVLYKFWSDLNERFLSSDDGLPKINTVIRPVTAAQSGVEGQLNVVDAFDFMTTATPSSSLMKSAGIQSSGIVLSNLDTMAGEPKLNLFKVAGPRELTNSFQLGSKRPLTAETNLVVRIDSADTNSPLAFRNEVKIKVWMKNAVNVDFTTSILKREFLEFEFKDLLNVHCWLSVLSPPDIDVYGNALLANNRKGFEFTKLLIAVEELDFDVQCTTCTSAGGQALPKILSTLKETSNMIDILREDIENFVNDTLYRYWDAFDIHTKISRGRKLCPSSMYYDASLDGNNMEFVPNFPSLSRDTLESIAFFGMLSINSLISLTAKSHLLSPAKPTDPFSSQNTLQLPTEGQLIDWGNLNTTLGDWATSALREIGSAFNETVVDDETEEENLGANQLIREWFGEDGILTIDIPNMKFETNKLGGLNVTIQRMRILGLDTFQEADILTSIAPQTMSNKLKLERLRIELDIQIEEEEEDTTNNLATLSFELGDIDIDLSILLALDYEKLKTMQVGSILMIRKILPCLVAKFHDVDITQLLVSANKFYNPQLKGFLSPDRDETLRTSVNEFNRVFQNDIIASIPKIWDGTVREILNHVLRDYLTQEELYCSYIDNIQVDEDGVVDFRDLLLSGPESKSLGGSGTSPYGDSMRLAYQILQENLLSSKEEEVNNTDTNNRIITRSSSLNEMFVQPFTYEQSNENGTLLFPGEVMNYTGDVTLANWNIEIMAKVSNVRIENLDSIGHPLKLMQPVDGQPSVLSNTLSMGVEKPFRASATFFLSMMDNNELNITNEIDVVLDVHTLTIVLSMYLAMSEKLLFDLPLKHLQRLDCWLSSVLPESFIDDNEDGESSRFQYQVAAEKVDLNISCSNCGSPRFDALIEQLYNPGESPEEVDRFVAEVQDVIDNFAGSDFLRTLAQKIVSDASITCPASPNYNPDVTSSSAQFWVQPESYLNFNEPSVRDKNMKLFNLLMGIMAAFFILCALIAQYVLRWKNQRWLDNLPIDQADILRLQDRNEEAKDKYLNEYTTSMFDSVKYVPFEIRYGVPVMLLLNIGLYLGAHFGVLCYLNIESQVAGDQFRVQNFFEFRFFDAALRTYYNGGNEMAVFLITFSGIWPYVKLILALIIWFLPPVTLPVAHREKLLLWMDALTKLSIIDIATLLVGVAALLVYIGGRGEEFYNSEALYAMTIVVVPQAGFYCIIIAQRLNRVSSRFFLDYHHMIVLSALEEYRKRNRIRLPSNYNELGAFRRSLNSSGTTVASSQSFRSDPSFEISQHGSVTFPDASMNSSGSSNNIRSSPASMKNKSLKSVRQGSWESTASASIPSRAVMYAQQRSNNKTVVSSFTSRDDEADHDNSDDQNDDDACCLQFKSILGGTIGVIFAGLTVLIIFIMGCALAPAGSFDVKDMLSLTLESGRTYADAVDDFNVFRMISLVFLKARFVLSSTSDYVGLGILLFLGFVTVVLFPLMQGWKKLKEWRQNSCSENDDGNIQQRASNNKRKSIIPGFTNRLKVYHHMEVYIISFCIANWQLGAVIAYALHNYCFLLQRFYETLSYVGLVEATESNCFRRQAADPLTLVIFIGSFLLLLASFIMQMLTQYKKNKLHAEEEFIEDVENAESDNLQILRREKVQGLPNLVEQPFDVIIERRFEPVILEGEEC